MAEEKIIQFDECCNYRGPLQIKKKADKFYWRVFSDVSAEDWHEIPEYLWVQLHKYHEETYDTRNNEIFKDDDDPYWGQQDGEYYAHKR